LKFFYLHIVLLISVLFLVRCAQPRPLTGGPEDNDAPILDSTKVVIPANGTVNFSATEIVIPFNEFISLKNEKKQIVITPFLEPRPDFYVKGKKLYVKFNGFPEPNTTYIINFGDAIVDLTKGNIVTNFSYVFSTGTYLDSLSYSSFIYDSYSKAPLEDAFLLLYKEDKDSIPLIEKPYYFAKTNSSGRCKINNIASGSYKVFVLQDLNSNYIFDQAKEKIGFLEHPITITSDTVLLDTIGVFKNKIEKGKISEIKVKSNGHGIAILDHPALEDLQLEAAFTNLLWKKEAILVPTKDTLTFWLDTNVVPGKNKKINLNGFQSAGFKVVPPTDTVLSFRTNAAKGVKPNETFSIIFSQPIASIDESKMTLLENDNQQQLYYTGIQNKKVVFSNEMLPDSSYLFEALPGAFTSIYGITNDTIAIYAHKNEPNQYGNVSLEIETKDKHQYILELLKQDKTIQRLLIKTEDEKTVIFKNLDPGKYTYRLVFDVNNNDVWDSGNYFEKRYPERVEYYKEVINVRKGWDLELKWILK